MLIVAIDPGTTVSAYLEWDGVKIYDHRICDNHQVLNYLKQSPAEELFIEQLACMGQTIGREVLETAFWSGRFAQYWEERRSNGGLWRMIPRTTIKKHHKARNDTEMRAALVIKYGQPGTKKNPGLTYGLKSHLWQAFALATWVSETGG